jgi:hypothetical protein
LLMIMRTVPGGTFSQAFLMNIATSRYNLASFNSS